MTWPQEVREAVADLITRGKSIAATSRIVGVSIPTIRIWMEKDPDMRKRLIEGKLRAAKTVIDLENQLYRMAMDMSLPTQDRQRAIRDILRAIDPGSYDAQVRKLMLIAQDPQFFNSRVQYQDYLDNRDAKIQRENAAKALEAKVIEDEDPKGQLSLEFFIEDLRDVQKKAGEEVAKQSDSYTGSEGEPDDAGA